MSRASTSGQTIGPPPENEYAVDPVGVDTTTPSHPNDDERTTVDLGDDLEHALPRGLLDGGLVERPATSRLTCWPTTTSTCSVTRSSTWYSPARTRSTVSTSGRRARSRRGTRRGRGSHRRSARRCRGRARPRGGSCRRRRARRRSRAGPTWMSTPRMSTWPDATLRHAGCRRTRRRASRARDPPRAGGRRPRPAASIESRRPVWETRRMCRSSLMPSPPSVLSPGGSILSDCPRHPAGSAPGTRGCRGCRRSATRRARSCRGRGPTPPRARSSVRRSGAPGRATMPSRTPERPTSNCGLTSRTKSSAGTAAAEGRQHQPQRDERRGRRRPGSSRQRTASSARVVGRGEVAGVDPLDHGDTLVERDAPGRSWPCPTSSATTTRRAPRCSSTWANPGARADVEHDPSGRVDAERVERADELARGAGHPLVDGVDHDRRSRADRGIDGFTTGDAVRR